MPGIRSGVSARPGVRQKKRLSTVSTSRYHSSTAATPTSSSSSAMASRIGRARAVSPAESLASIATTATATAGGKRKERDFEIDGAATAGEETNINVVVRCRGRNEREVRENSAVVVNTDGAKGKVVELMMGPNALSNKSYYFDRVFSPAADQGMIFDDVVKPILDQMLSGFNCTIFAYGQTGTGKTYTMSGDMTETLGLLSDAAGIIPRVLQSLFQKLEDTDNVVRCSFIELYNEELRDLLSADGDSGTTSKLKIYDDNSRKGHATTVVQGMEERHITSAAAGIKRLQEGSIRRQVAATKCNDLSSRSHTVFTITVQSKHVAENGEDFFITGKLNLVDLAGSENIQRSGAENKRAAEAGLINKSLLTLGRVINALVDRTAHVPYRESKLTRLLQDSLGGRTKTCIIATISTAKSNLEETISTLDYAFRAKNIRNKPQVNQLLNKKTLLREFSAELEKVKGELIVTRQRNGVYLSNEAYEEMTVQSESRRILAEEQAAKMETMENNLRNKLQELVDLTSNFMGLKKEHEGTRTELDGTKEVLGQTEVVLAATRKTLAEETTVRQAHQATEQRLAAIGSELVNTLDRTVDDIAGLHAKNRRKSDLQGVNRNTWAGVQAQVSDITRLVESRVVDMRTSQEQHISTIARRLQSFVQDGQQSLSSTQAILGASLDTLESNKNGLLVQQNTTKEEMDQLMEEIRSVRNHIQEHVGESLQVIATAAERIAEDVLSEIGTFHSQLHTSYSTLGKDCKGIFEDLLKHMAVQRSESENLRCHVEAAARTAVESNATVALQIQQAVEEERRLAAEDRARLLTQIGSLITAQAEIQDSRFAAKADVLRSRMLQSNESLEGGLSTYAEGMDAWNVAADDFAQNVSQSRDVLKGRFQDDWTAANEHSTSIQNTTRSVHAETVRVVGEQMQDLTVQMQDLDGLVARATLQTATHVAQHGASVAKMAEAVSGSLSQASVHAQNIQSRTAALGTDVEADVADARTGLAPVDETICLPLGDLRAFVGSTSLREYVATGDTPEKTHYRYPLDLPRTAPYSVLLQRPGDADCSDNAPLLEEDLLEAAIQTPSKIISRTAEQMATATTTTTDVPVIFNDIDPPDQEHMQSSPGAYGGDFSIGGLREVNPNLTKGPAVFDASANTMSTVHDLGSGLSGLRDLDDGAIPNAAATTTTAANIHHNSMSSALPLFRRSTRQHPHQQPPQKQIKLHKTPMVSLEGRENVPPSAFSQSSSRRRRSPRLN